MQKNIHIIHNLTHPIQFFIYSIESNLKICWKILTLPHVFATPLTNIFPSQIYNFRRNEWICRLQPSLYLIQSNGCGLYMELIQTNKPHNIIFNIFQQHCSRYLVINTRDNDRIALGISSRNGAPSSPDKVSEMYNDVGTKPPSQMLIFDPIRIIFLYQTTCLEKICTRLILKQKKIFLPQIQCLINLKPFCNIVVVDIQELLI